MGHRLGDALHRQGGGVQLPLLPPLGWISALNESAVGAPDLPLEEARRAGPRTVGVEWRPGKLSLISEIKIVCARLCVLCECMRPIYPAHTFGSKRSPLEDRVGELSITGAHCCSW